MRKNNFVRGSEWRIWDLHVHTPASVLNNGFGNDWDEYVKKMFKKALSKNIAAIGITDYFSIEGYKRIKQDYLADPEKLRNLFSDDEIAQIRNILILPNIEFRLDKFVNDSRINFHVLFSDQVSVTDIEENFLHELDFAFEGNPQSPEERHKLKIANLEGLGRKLKVEHPKFKDPDLFVGMMNAVVSDKQICDVLTGKPSMFAGRYLLAIPSDEDLSQVSWDGQGHQSRKVLIQKSDCLFSSNAKTIKWGLGLTESSPDIFIKEFKSLKPCVWGSDAHNFDELFEKNSSRLLWIKSDATFEGLYQIKYEPKERVLIQEIQPETKKPYLTIDKVSFIDNRTFPKFSGAEIPINQNLSAIIGGKSTGKSLLLYHIAKTIDSQQVDEKVKLLGSQSLGYDFNLDPDFDFKVVWSDEGANNLKEVKHDETRKITYIPQHYLSNLSKKNNLDDKKSLNDFIRETLLADATSRKAEERARETSHSRLQTISNLINDVFAYQEDIITQRNSIKEKGDKSGITKYIDQLKREIEQLKLHSTLTFEESQMLDRLSKDQETRAKELSNLTADSASVATFFDKAKTIAQRLQSLKSEYSSYLNSAFAKSEFDEKFSFIENLEKSIQDAKDAMVGERGNVTSAITSISGTISNLRDSLQPLLANVKQQEALNIKVSLLKQEEEKLNHIEMQEKLLLEKRKALKATFDKIFVEYDDVHASYKLYQESLTRAKEELKEVQISVKLSFNSAVFSERLSNQIQRQDLKKQYTEHRDEQGEFYLQYSTFADLRAFLDTVFKDLINERVRLYKNQTVKDALTTLLDDYFFLDFAVSYKGDSLEKMSPGKRNLVLLKIIIEKNNQEWPILIDQPEDDLDNRSVYNDLVTFLKEKKKNRQIIIVTHNPNAVVGADAEQVIVANQSGQDSNRTNEIYDFEYVSGGLEHSAKKDEQCAYVLSSMGIRQHVCDILEGGEDAFKKREEKYGL